MIRFLKIRTSKDALGGVKTMYLQVERETPKAFFGRKVNRSTLADDSYTRKDGVIVDMHHLVLKSAIAWIQPMEEDRKYGGLVPVGAITRPE